MSETAGTVVAMEPQDQPVAAITPMELLQRAVDTGADLERLEKLMALHERWEASNARKAFVAALSAFKADPPTVFKTKKANFGGGGASYDYATLADCVAAIVPALSRHGLSHRWATEQADKQVSVTCTLTHVMGHSETVTLAAGADDSGKKNAIQQIGSTITYLQRYTLLAITGLAAEGQDDDAEGADFTVISPEQKDELVALMREANADTDRFLRFLGIDYIDRLPAKRFNQAKGALEKKIKENAA